MGADEFERKESLRTWLRENVVAGQFTSLIENPPPASRLELVRVWLEDNVLKPATPKRITLTEITFDWERLRGSFRLSLDQLILRDKFDAHIDITGRPAVTPPLFCSPLGAPATYAAVELDDETNAALIRSLELIFPRMRAYGIHKDINRTIMSDSSAKDRILDAKEYQTKRQRIEEGGLTITMALD